MAVTGDQEKTGEHMKRGSSLEQGVRRKDKEAD
jgi:hypothetical protein